MTNYTEQAETAIDAANQNLRSGDPQTAQVAATVAVAQALLALKQEVASIKTRMP